MIKKLKEIIFKIKDKYQLRKYNDFTISDCFRSQGAIVGENNRIMIRHLGREPYLIKIGNHCSISNGVKLITHDGGTWIFTEEMPFLQKMGKIEIKDNCYIGLNCIVLPNVTIGPNSIVGAGSVVTKDVPPNSIVAGNPARVIKSVDEYREKVEQIWEKQKPAGYPSNENKSMRYTPQDIQRIKIAEKHILKEHIIKYFWGHKG